VVALRFEIVFHAPFRVSSGRAGDGSDATVDRAALLPASSLKGVMLSAARDLLKFAPSHVGAVFGTAWQASPWGWSDAVMTEEASVRPRTRIRIDPGTGTVVRGALLVADEVLAARAEFSVDRISRVDPGEVSVHEAILLAAARSVTAVGAGRRRGTGWVTVTPVDPPWTDAHLRAAVSLTGTAGQGTGSAR
jgi:CRISPR/Cas system CMR subunit Cmr4 (Cas7 group RAMP superfamily)